MSDDPLVGRPGLPGESGPAVTVLVYAASRERGESVKSTLGAVDEPLSVSVVTDAEAARRRIERGAVDCLVCTNGTVDRTEPLADGGERTSSPPVVCWADVDPAGPLEVGAVDVVRPPEDASRRRVVARRVRALGERHRAKRDAERFRSIFETLPDAVFVHDEAGDVLAVNAQVPSLLGYDRSTLLEMNVADLETTLTAAELEETFRALAPGECKTVRGRNRRADGSEIPVRVSLRRVDDGDDPRIIASVRDLTELVDRERELERSLDLLEQTEAIANAGGWELDLRRDELRWTDGIRRIFGVDADYEPTLAEAIEFYHPADRPRIERAVDRAIDEGVPYDETLRIVTADDETRWIRSRGEPHQNDGEVIRVRGAIWDVTDRERRRREVRANNAKFEALMRAFPDVAAIIDEDGHYREVYAGEDAQSLLIADEADLVDEHVEDVLPVEPAATLREAVEEALESGAVRTIEYQLDVPVGTRWFEGRVAPLDERIDGSRAVVLVARDVTEHKDAIEELQTREAHLTQAQAVANLGSWYKDIPSDVIYWSSEIYDIFGLDEEAGLIDHERFMAHVHPEDSEFVEEEWEAAKRGEPYEVEHRIVTADGETRWVRQLAKLSFEDGDPISAVGVVQDVTDRKEYERRLEAKTEQLDVLNRVIRHDMRNQMNVIDGYAAVLEERFDEAKPIASRIRSVAEDLLSISEEIRTVNRLITDEADRHPINVTDVVDDAIEAVADEYADFDCDRSIASDVWIRGTEAVRVAIENVVENAVEHNTASEPRIEITAEERDDGVVVRVADNGPGIPRSERELLTGARERSQLEHSSGVGLWIVNWIVASVDGEITFDSRPDRGTVVTLRFPKAESVEPELRR